jgi:hypothetical protein
MRPDSPTLDTGYAGYVVLRSVSVCWRRGIVGHRVAEGAIADAAAPLWLPPRFDEQDQRVGWTKVSSNSP